jgi:hypothetical protein
VDIAKYFISVGFKIDKKEVNALDKALKDVEAGLKKSTTTGTKAEVVEKKLTKAKKDTTKVVDEQTAALKKAAVAEAAWIKQAREGQKVSNATFRAREAARKFELAGMRKMHTEALKLDKAFNKAGKSPTMMGVNSRGQSGAWKKARAAAIKSMTIPALSSSALKKRQLDLEAAFGVGVKSKPLKIVGGYGSTRSPAGQLSGRLAHLDADKTNSSLSSMRSYYLAQERAAVSSIKAQNAEVLAGVRMKERAETRAANAELARRKQVIAENKKNLAQQNAMQRAEDARNNKGSMRAAAQRARAEHQAGQSQSFGGMPVSLPFRALGPAAIAYGAWSGGAALYRGNKTAVSNRNFITNVSGTAGNTEEQNQAAGKQSFEYLYSEANRLGLNAKEQAEPYGKLLAAAQASGASLPAAQKMFSQLSEHGATMHLDAVGQKRMVKALGDVFSKGQVYAEELKGQMGDASPTFPSYVAQAWAEKTKSGLTGAKAMGALQKDMSDSKVGSDIMYRALEIASEKAQPSLARSTSTSQAEENRIANIASYSLNEASVAGLEDGFYRMNKAIKVFAEDLAPMSESMMTSFGQTLGATSDFILGLRQLSKGDTVGGMQTIKDNAGGLPAGYLASLNPVTLAAYGGYKLGEVFGNTRPEFAPDTFGIKGATDFPNYKQQALEGIRGSGSPSGTVMIQPGAFTINTQATDAAGLRNDLEPMMVDVFKQQQAKSWQETIGQFSYKE